MTGVVLVSPRTKFTNSSGIPIAGGTVTVYLAGTTTLATTYQDKALTTANTNPITLDANGECLLWVDSAYTYKILLADADGATVSGYPVDNLPGVADIGAAATAAAAAAASSAAAAATSAAAAAASAAAALANGRIYASTAAGLAAVASGEYFVVPQASTSNTFYDLYLNSAGSAVYVNSYPSTALVATINAAVTSTVTTYGLTTTTSNFAAGATYYGIRATGAGTIKNLNVNVTASGTGAYLVARRRVTGTFTTHEVESITTGVAIAASGVNTIPVSITVAKGDMVLFAMTAGGGLRYQAAGSEGGAVLAAPSVGTKFNAPSISTTNQPSISYDLVQNTKINTHDNTINGLRSGLEESFAETTQTFGDVTVGGGAPTTGGASRGTVALSPPGLLTQVRWRTPAASKMVDGNVIVWGPPTDASSNYTALQILPVSVLTDAGGLATATADDLGPVLVPEGCYIHVLGFDATSGVLSYSADTRGSTVAIGGTVVGVGTVCQISPFSSTAAYAVEYTITQSDALTLAARVDANDRFKTAISSGLGTESLKVGIMSGEFDGSSYAYTGGYAVPRDGTITQFSVDLTAAGTGIVALLRPANANRYRVVSQTAYTAASANTNTFTCSIAAKAGDLLAPLAQTGGFLRHNSNSGSGIGFAYDTMTVGSLLRVSSPANPALYFTVSAPRTAQLDTINKGGRLLYQPFTANTRPSDWTESGGTWVYGNGATPPAAPGYNCYTVWNQSTSISKRTNAVRVTVNDTAASQGLFFFSNAGGSMVVVNGTAGQLQIRNWTPSFTSALIKSVALPAALTAGRDYIISAKKDGLSVTATFYDTVTQQTCAVTATITDGYAPLNGQAGCIYVSGSTAPKFKWVSMDHPLDRRNVRTLVLGDSNAEGSNATLAGATPWPVQLQNNSASGDVILANQSGDPTDISYRAFTDLQHWLPRYVVVALGTNNTATGLNKWRGQMSITIALIEALGAEPILCTVIPRSGTAVPASMNTDIKTGYFGAYRYIDLASAVSTSHDGTTLDATMYVGDGLHLNAAGHNACYAQVLADAPFLLW